MADTRVEKDSLGTVAVPAERLWGAQTQRSITNFPIGNERMPEEIVAALVLVKKAAAEVNAARGALPPTIADAISRAADEVLAGLHREEFPLVVWQTGSGTQTNMNVNEVLANRASELCGGRRGDKHPVHPNDHVNLAQSSNDTFPTAMSVAAVRACEERLLPALAALAAAIEAKAEAWRSIVKIGRTHLMDATPLTLGQEASGWAAQLRSAEADLRRSLDRLAELAIGGTAVGTGINAPAGWDRLMAEALSRLVGRPFIPAPNKFQALASHDPFVTASGALSALACALTKIGNDVRWLGSGPRCGLGELVLPANEPGSSIMPGKVNPTQAEAVLMVAARVVGNHTTITFANAQGNLELNVAKPVIAHAFLESVRLLADAMTSFRERCVEGLEPNRARIAEHLERSLMLVTALAPTIGYDAAARVALHAHAEGITLREAVLRLGALPADDFDRLIADALAPPATGP